MKLEPKIVTATLCVAICAIVKLMILDFDPDRPLRDFLTLFGTSFGEVLGSLIDIILFGAFCWLVLLMRPQKKNTRDDDIRTDY